MDNRAVSSVIATILMVALVVVLSGIVMVMGLDFMNTGSLEDTAERVMEGALPVMGGYLL